MSIQGADSYRVEAMAAREHAATLRRMLKQAEAEITALRAALDQERDNVQGLRAFAQAALYSMRSDRKDLALLVEFHRHNLLDDKGNPTALLSGRGEVNDG